MLLCTILYRGGFMKSLFTRMAAGLLAAVLFFPAEVSAISAQNAILEDAQTGCVLYEKNANNRVLIASTTKIMTALVICEQANILDLVRIPKEAVGIEGSSIYLQEGEILSVHDLLLGLMLHSGNDAAIALAIYCGGTVDGFVDLMNDKAYFLGLTDTHFANPHGLDDKDNYSTAGDMSTLAAYAMENPIFRKIVSTKTCNIGRRTLRNHNKMLWRFEGADGVKTGFTKASGRILVSSALRNGRRLICVTMDDPNDWEDHLNLFEHGFSQYTLYQIIAEGTVLGSIAVAGGTAGYAQLVADNDFQYPLVDGEEVSIIIRPENFVYAPVIRGKEAGVAYICINGKPVGKVNLCFGDTIEMTQELVRPFWKRIFKGD